MMMTVICEKEIMKGGVRVFHENKKLEFYLLLLTTVDYWSKYFVFEIFGPRVNVLKSKQ